MHILFRGTTALTAGYHNYHWYLWWSIRSTASRGTNSCKHSTQSLQETKTKGHRSNCLMTYLQLWTTFFAFHSALFVANPYSDAWVRYNDFIKRFFSGKNNSILFLTRRSLELATIPSERIVALTIIQTKVLQIFNAIGREGLECMIFLLVICLILNGRYQSLIMVFAYWSCFRIKNLFYSSRKMNIPSSVDSKNCIGMLLILYNISWWLSSCEYYLYDRIEKSHSL